MNKLSVIKIGGNVLDDKSALHSFLKYFSQMEGLKVLVHGGGKRATALAKELGIEQRMVGGRRITDEETLKVVTMVYAGEINKTLVAELQGLGCNAIGLSGADGNLILSKKRINKDIDYGFAGDVETVNTEFLNLLLQNGYVPILAPITHDGKGQLLNTNADTIANKIAIALANHFEVNLYYLFEKNGVLLNAEDPSSLIETMDEAFYKRLKEEKKVFAGMLPKLDNAFEALREGVTKVVIGNSDDIKGLINSKAGTTISNG